MPSGFLPDNSVRVVNEGVYDVVTWANVFYCTFDGAIDGSIIADLNAWVDGFISASAQLYNTSGLSNKLYHLRTKAKFMDSSSAITRVVRPSTNQGTASGDAVEGQVCLLLDAVTRDARRGGKSRTYIPGLAETALADSANLSPAAIASFTTNANAFHNAVNTLTLQTHHTHLVEMSFVNAKALRGTGVGFEILSYNASNAIATQRRRVDRLRLS